MLRMQSTLTTILLSICLFSFGQKNTIITIFNNNAPVSYCEKAYHILKKHQIPQDSADEAIHKRIKECIFIYNDTNRYALHKLTIDEVNLNNEILFPFRNAKLPYQRYIRPRVEIIEQNIDMPRDYLVTINKINIRSGWFSNKIEFYFSVYDSDLSEVVSDVHTERYDIHENIAWETFLQILWEPCEGMENRILQVIDDHSAGYKPHGRNYSHEAHAWQNGYMVTTEGDTLKGEIKYADPYKFHFRLAPESPPRLVSSMDVSYFQAGDNAYKTLFLHQISNGLGKFTFCEVIMDGKLCLYRLGDHETVKYYVKKQDSETELRVRFTPDRKRIINKDELKPLFSENTSLARQMDHRKFGAKDLEKLVYLYNQ